MLAALNDTMREPFLSFTLVFSCGKTKGTNVFCISQLQFVLYSGGMFAVDLSGFRSTTGFIDERCLHFKCEVKNLSPDVNPRIALAVLPDRTLVLSHQILYAGNLF